MWILVNFKNMFSVVLKKNQDTRCAYFPEFISSYFFCEFVRHTKKKQIRIEILGFDNNSGLFR